MTGKPGWAVGPFLVRQFKKKGSSQTLAPDTQATAATSPLRRVFWLNKTIAMKLGFSLLFPLFRKSLLELPVTGIEASEMGC
ncbi:hypothetical protein V6N12_073371 [Hibiscus sabdariffa]|uniref:Uncharacterized protein n=1 Tax=Hibiscus sabdariffa TaxID=183260 RepID=A0ABR2BT56_9ROSI